LPGEVHRRFAIRVVVKVAELSEVGVVAATVRPETEVDNVDPVVVNDEILDPLVAKALAGL